MKNYIIVDLNGKIYGFFKAISVFQGIKMLQEGQQIVEITEEVVDPTIQKYDFKTKKLTTYPSNGIISSV